MKNGVDDWKLHWEFEEMKCFIWGLILKGFLEVCWSQISWFGYLVFGITRKNSCLFKGGSQWKKESDHFTKELKYRNEE
jgi:hypothetical protein